MLGIPHVYIIEDPEPDRIDHIFGYKKGPILEIKRGEPRYVGYSAAEHHVRVYKKTQKMLYGWLTHLTHLGFGTKINPLRKRIHPFVSTTEALKWERNLGTRLGLAKDGGRLLNQVEPGGDTYGGGPSIEGRKRISAYRKTFVVSNETKQRQSEAGFERAKRERKTGFLHLRNLKIARSLKGQPHPHKKHKISEYQKAQVGSSKRTKALGRYVSPEEWIEWRRQIFELYDAEAVSYPEVNTCNNNASPITPAYAFAVRHAKRFETTIGSLKILVRVYEKSSRALSCVPRPNNLMDKSANKLMNES
jgi:hypothetical protein